jgi:hypothetical protein
MRHGQDARIQLSRTTQEVDNLVARTVVDVAIQKFVIRHKESIISFKPSAATSFPTSFRYRGKENQLVDHTNQTVKNELREYLLNSILVQQYFRIWELCQP